MTDTKILLFTIVAFLISTLYITQSAWAPSDELTFVGNSHFQNLPTLYPGENATFTIKLWLDGPSQIHEIKPVIDVYPVSANSHVKIETDTLDHLEPNTAGTFHVTITSDPGITTDKIFLSAYFVAKDSYGKTVKGGWSERDSWIDVEQYQQSDSLITQLEQARQKIEQEVTIITTPHAAKYGDDLLIYASLPSYKKPDELRYFIDVFDPDGKKIDSTLWFARQDFNYTMRTEHPAFKIVKGGTYTVSAEKANGFERTGEIVKTISFTLTQPSPLKQSKLGISAEEIKCKQDLELVIKTSNGKPVCVTPETKIKLIKRGWANETGGNLVTLREGDREGSLLVQKIFQDGISGLNFLDYPVARDTGSPITLHVGDTASNGCTVELTLVKTSNSTATFLKKEHNDRPCPICLSGDTVIDTPNGAIDVKDVKKGMIVYTQDESGHKYIGIILQTGKTMVSTTHKMTHLVLDDKRELYVSPNHPTADERLFGDLLVGDTLDGSKIKNIELVQYDKTYTYDILPSGPTGFYWANGILTKSTLK